MATFPNPEELWTVREYSRSSWSPDREFVDGRIEERNFGGKEHSIIQGYLTYLFNLHRANWKVRVFPELRTQTRNTRFRVPDVLVVRASEKFEHYVTQPPLIAIEILSPEDTLRAIQEKAVEYRLFGVEHIWIIDPEPRLVYVATGAGLEEVRGDELAVPGTPIRVQLGEMFAELDEQ